MPQRISSLTRFLHFALLVVMGTQSPLWALTPAGTSITNRALGSYTDGDTGYSSMLQSNIVSAEVQPLEALALAPNQAVQSPVGAPINLAHRLTNTGNTQSQYKISIANISGDSFDISGLKVVRDLNDNGIADAGEPEVGAQPPVLGNGESASLVISGTVPGSALPDTSAQIKLTAETTAQSASAFNTDTISISSALSLQAFNAASVPNAKAGDTITFTLSALNRGTTAPLPVPVSVDGISRELILLRDVVPANTSLTAFTIKGTGLALYHRIGDPEHTYLSRAPQDLNTVDAIAYAVPSFAAGATLQATFSVQLHHNINVEISNTAHLVFAEPGKSGVQNIDTNEVHVGVPVSQPTIFYYSDATFSKVATVTSLNWPLFIQVDSASDNKNPTLVERVQVTNVSRKTGDILRVEAIETGPNSGIFRFITTPVDYEPDDIPTNNVLEAHEGDILTASFVTGGLTISHTILVDPYGVVYDSRTNLPIAGVRVTLIDVTGEGNGGRPGQEATVFNMDGSSAPSSIVTGADGRFQFPQVAPSTYRFVVVTPAGCKFPCNTPAALQPIGRVIHDPGSFGGNFVITAVSSPVQIDIPLDASALQTGLFLEKTAARSQVDMGDFLDYELHLKNSTTGALPSVTIADTLPVGFKFQAGSARLNGATTTPTVASGRDLSFNVGALAIGAEVRVSYRVLVGIGTKLGKNTNIARANWASTQSNEASASVNVQGGVFDDKGIILGRIWIDANRDDQIQDGEVGIPGVRIWLEDGTFVLTDEDGKYSFYGLEARTHVVKVDVTTLPKGTQLQSLSSRYGKGGASYIIDLKKGELHKINFADRAATPEIIAEARARRELAANSEGEAAQSLATTLTPDGSLLQPGDVRALPATGFVGNANQTRFGVNSGENGGTGLAPAPRPAPLDSRNSNLPNKPVALVPAPAPTSALDAALPTIKSSDLGFINLKDGATLAFAQSNVQVKGAAGSNFKLRVNGVEVPETRIGQRSTTPDGQTDAWEFVGVKMNPGRNTVRLEQTDSFGIERGKTEITVIAPGDLGRLEITVPSKSPFADGRTTTKISVRLADAKGALVSTRTALTLEASVGQWQTTDLNPAEPGVQVFIEGGKAEFELLAPSQPANCDIRISSGALQNSACFAFVPELRPLFVNGLASARINLFGFKARGAGTIRTEDIFESEDAARGALFVKGRILGSSLLTLRYDSQKREDDRLFRDIQPDAYYPIYGDSGSRGFDAQSTSKLYVRVDNQKSYVLYGDYTTSSLNTARSLGDYNRSLTGLKTHVEKGRLNANVFASNDNARQVVEELRGNGTSGTYLLSSGDVRDQSEKVEIIVRDRNQPSVVLQTTPQSRFVDYTLDNFSQGIVFRSPVPSVDANLNPIFIRVTYEVEQGGPKFLVAGADVQYQLNNKVGVGAAYSRDQNPQDPFSLRSLNATVRFAPNTTLVGEWAQSSRGDASGDAQRLELLHEGRKLSARLFWGRSDTTFDNPASLLSQGRQEATFKATYKLNGTNRLIAEAIRSNDVSGGGTRTGAQIALQRSLGNGIQIEVGARKVKDSGTPFPGTNAQPADFTSLRAKVTAPVPGLPRANAFLEYERAVQGDGQVLALGGDFQIANRGRVYVRHELISSLTGRYGLNDSADRQSTLIGIDADYMKNGRVFSEYRVGGGINGRDAQASIGLRNGWSLGRGVRFNTTFERIRDLGQTQTGQTSGDSTAITGALEYTRSTNFKGTARLELRNGASDSILGSVGVAYKINPSLSLLGKGIYSRTNSPSSTGVDLNSQNQSRAVLGLAYRSTKNDRLQALLKYEMRRNISSLSTRLRRSAQIASLNVNYQASRKWNLTGHYALQTGSDISNGLVSNATLQVLSGRATYNLGRRADLSLLASASRGAGVSQMGLGAELGFRITSGLRLSAGYLFGHFRDTDAATLDLDDSGFYLRFGYQFDEGLLGGLVQ